MNSLSQKLLIVASICLSFAGILFLCVSLFGTEKTWTLPAALGCISLSFLFQVIFRQVSR